MDYNILTTDGNIAFYNSCEVTELFLCRKKDKAIFNFFTVAVFEEQLFTNTNETFLTNKPIKVNDEYSIGIERFWLSMPDALNNYQILKAQNKWKANGLSSSQFPQLKFLPKQFIPSIEGNRINNILKNNFHNGSYILEFFDESKSNMDFLLKIEAIYKLNELSEKIKQVVPIDLSVVRDRIGNFIFQFPITILETNSKPVSTWDGVELDFSWHPSIQNPPDCLLQVESTIDKNYMGSVIVDYNKTQNQTVNIGNLDQINHIKIWRKEPSLILSTFSGTFIREYDFRMGIINPEPRLFEVDGNMVEIQITSTDRDKKKTEKTNYKNYISNNLYDAEKKQLEKLLSFKQFLKIENSVALNDIRKLITQYDKNGVYLWDPYLRADDIFKTLFYSKTSGVDIKAIGSTNQKLENNLTKECNGKVAKTAKDVIAQQKSLFENPKNNNYGLKLEFRMQHGMSGWKFHDRFLIFKGKSVERAKVFSLGTSINSFGKEHNILQEVSHPQPVVDAFNELWDELNKPECLVWKFPK